MKIAESWLREWVDPDIDTEVRWSDRLTMARPRGGRNRIRRPWHLDGVVIAEVLDVRSHPDADRLSVCTVAERIGAILLIVVCGAPNVVKGMKSPLATPGVTLAKRRQAAQVEDSRRDLQRHAVFCRRASARRRFRRHHCAACRRAGGCGPDGIFVGCPTLLLTSTSRRIAAIVSASWE